MCKFICIKLVRWKDHVLKLKLWIDVLHWTWDNSVTFLSADTTFLATYISSISHKFVTPKSHLKFFERTHNFRATPKSISLSSCSHHCYILERRSNLPHKLTFRVLVSIHLGHIGTTTKQSRRLEVCNWRLNCRFGD